MTVEQSAFVVSLAKIRVSDRNHRIGALVDAEFVASVEQNGVLEPVLVKGPDDKGVYDLIAGARRVEASKRAKRETIPIVIAGPADMPLDREDDLRAIENLHRKDLSDAERVVVVNHTMQTAMPEKLPEDPAALEKVRREAVAAAAKRLGKSERWIVKYWRLGRLSTRAAKQLHEGNLPEALALELCAIASDTVQNALLDSWDKWAGSVDVEAFIEEEVRPAQRTLAGVEWDLDERVGDRPPCSTCEHNAANQQTLYGAGDMRCLNAACYDTKNEFTKKKIKVVSKAAVRQGVALTVNGIEKLTTDRALRLDGVKVEAVVHAAKERAAAESEKPKEPSAKKAGEKPTPEQIQKQNEIAAAAKANADRLMAIGKKLQEAVAAAFKKSDKHRAACVLAPLTDVWSEYFLGAPKQRAKLEPAMRRLLAGIAKGDGGEAAIKIGIRHVAVPSHLSAFGLSQMDDDQVDLVCGVFGVEVEKPAAAAKASKPKPSERGRRKPGVAKQQGFKKNKSRR